MTRTAPPPDLLRTRVLAFVRESGPTTKQSVVQRFAGYERRSARLAFEALAAKGRIRAVTNPRFVCWEEATTCL